nr:MAG TPA: hypothetical protein [Caudoviricetes sp.]
MLNVRADVRVLGQCLRFFAACVYVLSGPGFRIFSNITTFLWIAGYSARESSPFASFHREKDPFRTHSVDDKRLSLAFLCTFAAHNIYIIAH